MAYLFAFCKNAIYGASVFFTGTLTTTTDVLDVLALRFLLSFLVLWGCKMLHILQIPIRAMDLFRGKKAPSGMGMLILAALFEPVLYMLFETLGISMTNGITAGVILSLAPITGVIFESLLLHEKTTWMQKFWLALGIAGVIYIAVNTNTTDGSNSVWGILFLLLAIVSGALFMVFSRKSSGQFRAMEITYISGFVGMVLFNAVNVVRHVWQGDILSYFAPYCNVDNMIGFIFLSVISTIIATGMNNYALRTMQVSTMTAFGGVSTFVTVLIGVFVGNETLYTFHYIGFALILCRMIGVSYLAIKKEKMQETGGKTHDGNGTVATVD